MKNKILIAIVICLLLTPSSCKKEPICACGVENPQDNLDWLKSILLTMWSADIYKVNFLDNEYIIISDKDLVIDGIAVVYNCQGQKLCEDGGENIGGHVCDLPDPKSFWDTYNAKKILLFKLREQKVILGY
jgi:hypothetical protein